MPLTPSILRTLLIPCITFLVASCLGHAPQPMQIGYNRETVCFSLVISLRAPQLQDIKLERKCSDCGD